MSQQLLKRIESFRKEKKLPILTLCKMMDVHNVTYHRWRNAGQITGAYKKIVEDFLAKNDPSAAGVVSSSSIPSSEHKTSDIAVIGIACYYPGASNVRELWENILARRVQFRRMLDCRLPLSDYHDDDPKATDKTYLTKAAFLEGFLFDWGKLRIPKKTVESTDIAHWLALDIALKTFEDAGYKLSDIPLQNTGVIVGNTLTGEQTRSQTLRLRWPYVQKVLNATLGHLGKSIEERSQIASEMEKIYKSAFYPVTEDSLAGGLANTIAGRICNYLNLKGGGYIVDGACSSSLLAVATAADALKMGNMDLALAGGVDISLDPFELVGFSRAGALAKDQMRVYDQKANGFLPGEGCGFVLLKRLDDAIRDKDYVYATIKGWGISSDGKGGIMEPSSSGQSFAIGRAYKDLEYKISDVDFVEGHGTGTTKGDRVELEGIATAVERTIKKEDENKRGCGVTSFKSIVGHTKAAAGIGGLIKAVLAVNQRILPPTATCTQPNDVFKDKAKNLYPIIQGGVLPQNKKARAGISSAGFGGINCHITVESQDKPKEELKPRIDERALFVSRQETEVFVFTSRTIIHLKKVIGKFKEDLRNISLAEMADLAALLNSKVKNRLPIKAAIVTDTPEHLYEALILLENEIDSIQLEAGKIYNIKAKDIATHIILGNGVKKNRIGFLYPGQGSQRLNMTRNLVERYSWARDLFLLSPLSLFEKIYAATEKFINKEEQQEFEEKLSDTKITQPAIVLSSLIWSEFFSRLGIEPQITLGHSLGELTAFYKAGAFNKETLIKFAQFRGELMAANSRSSGSMVSLFCSKSKAESLIKEVSGNIVIANINSPNQTVVSGGKKEIEKIKELAQKRDVPARQLNVSNAFHSSFMIEASGKIKNTKILPDTFKSNDIKVYSCVSGKLVEGRVNLKEYFSKQVVSPVNFVGTIEAASKECDLLIELGPGKVLTDLVKAIDDKVLCLPLESFAGNDRDLNIALAEIFIRNVPIKLEELYKNRLIKTFVPASRKRFIENQCERPLKIDQQVLKPSFLPVLLEVKDAISQSEEVIPGGLPVSEGRDNIADLLVSLTHQITGFDKESITLNSRLLDDLNLDSIKAAELIGQAARQLGLAGQLDPSKLSNNTLGEIRNRLFELAQSRLGASAQGSGENVLKRYQDKTWVRDFIPVFKDEQIKSKNVNQLKELKNIVFLSGKDEEGLVKTLEAELKIAKVKASKTALINCLIAILPREGSQLNKSSLKSIIDQMHEITDLATSSRLGKDSFVIFVQFGGGATAIASTLFLERPDLKVRIIDFDDQILDKVIAEKVIDELQTYERFNLVKYDLTLKRKVIYYENSYPVDYKKREIAWSSKDVVLVTGGAKGITAQCSLEFARLTKAQMVLVGRSPMPENKKDETNEIVQTLNQFKRENLKASYYSCDVTNEKDVITTVKEIEKKLGKITGFIHGAGLNSLKRLKQASPEEAYKEALPKVMGAVNVCNALKDHLPKLIVGITSIIGITGMEGSGWYGLANETLNLYLQRVSTKETSVVTIAYSVWDEVGMGAKLGSVNKLAEKGIGAIPVKEGIKHFRQLVEADPGVGQVIVAARVAGLDTWKSSSSKLDGFRFIDKIEYFLPGVELIAQAQLNVQDDPYLLDHNWKGSLLFPFVFGFEAMTQSVAYVLGVAALDHIKAKDINLQRPIPVSQDLGTTIEIHAQVLEKSSRNGLVEVKVEVYSQESAYTEPHFSAVFEVNLERVTAKVETTKQSLFKKPSNVININPETDLYGPILFQGKMFQCIEKIHELFYDDKTKKGECLSTLAYNKSAGEFLKNNKKFKGRFLIGDPFFIDSMLQSMQLIIPQDISLPRDIHEIELSSFSSKNDSEHLLRSNIKKLDADHYRGDAEIVTDNILFRINNCRLKVLDTISSNPSANDLVDPAKRDQKIIEGRLNELSKELGFVPPVIKCAYDERLKNAPKELRHKIELPFIHSALEELLSKDGKSSKNLQIKWLKSGKPIIEGKNSEGIGISISHSGAFLIVIAGYGEQGCDVEIIQKRTNFAWREILGNEKYRILKKLVVEGEDSNKIGTIFWSAIEAAGKIFSSDKIEVLNFYKLNNSYFSHIRNSSKLITILSFAENQAIENKIILSIGIKGFNFSDISRESEIIKKNKDASISRKLGYDEVAHEMGLDYSGPQGQVVYTKRFPVTFKSNQNLSRSVYFTNYAIWMGEIREYGLYPIMRKLAELTSTGGWGIATNYVKIRILGELWGRDTVEARLWMVKSFGIKDSTFDWMFEWRKLLPTGGYERVATSELRTTWIKITGHGEAKIEEMPDFIQEFMDSMRPQNNVPTILEKLPESIKNISVGKFIRKNDILGSKKYLLNEESFKTSLEESNLVGNIYFANYAKWLGKTRDLYFQSIVPEYFKGVGDRGEFLALNCDIEHLQEAMPFDKILVRMYLETIYDKGFDLFFEFFRVDKARKEIKLAYGKQSVVWVCRQGLIPISTELPDKILGSILGSK